MGQEGVEDMAIWAIVLAEFYGLAEFGRIPWPSRIWQNFMAWQNLAKFYGLVELGRIWQKWQIAVDCDKLRSCAQSLLTKLVEKGSGYYGCVL